jgi:hypothetical protein
VIAYLFEVQDEIVSRLARSLNPQLIVAEARKAQSSLNPTAIDLYFRGPGCRDLDGRGRFFEQTLSLDPRSQTGMVELQRAGLVQPLHEALDRAAILGMQAEQ